MTGGINVVEAAQLASIADYQRGIFVKRLNGETGLRCDIDIVAQMDPARLFDADWTHDLRIGPESGEASCVQKAEYARGERIREADRGDHEGAIKGRRDGARPIGAERCFRSLRLEEISPLKMIARKNGVRTIASVVIDNRTRPPTISP